jgi:3-deoxy-D-manno-octulosonate 8-phosphate phosphatase (KDO 8-P phosphatase)
MGRSLKRLRERARKIKLVLMDVDGVLTDGRIYYLPRPKGALFEAKAFHCRDGLGIRLAHQAGLKTGVITGRGSPALEYRAKELGIHYLYQEARDKLEPYEKILHDARLDDEEVCYVGDDVVDLPLLKRVGLAVGVKDSHPALHTHVHYRTRRPGGLGAVRETIELILTAQGKWDVALRGYMKKGLEDRRQESGVASQKAERRKQKAGVRRQWAEARG